MALQILSDVNRSDVDPIVCDYSVIDQDRGETLREILTKENNSSHINKKKEKKDCGYRRKN